MSFRLLRDVADADGLLFEHTCTFKLGKLAFIKFKIRLISPESFVSIRTSEFSLDEEEEDLLMISPSPLLLFSFSFVSISSDLASGSRRRGGDGEHGDFFMFISNLLCSPKTIGKLFSLFSTEGDSFV